MASTMDELAVISESLNSLQNLTHKDPIFLDDLQKEFRLDLQNYIVGTTLSMRNGKLVIGSNLYKEWLKKLKKNGFDYEIDFKQ